MAKLTKTEQALLDRVRTHNDRGSTIYNPVESKKGARRSWRRGGGYDYRGPNKTQEAAWQRMVARGDVIKCDGGYAVPDHPILVVKAAEICLPKHARHVQELRERLEHAEAQYAEDQAFVRKYGLGIEP